MSDRQTKKSSVSTVSTRTKAKESASTATSKTIKSTATKSVKTDKIEKSSGLYAKGGKIDRDKIINTFKSTVKTRKSAQDSDSSDDVPEIHGNVDDLLVDDDGNRLTVQKQYESDSASESEQVGGDDDGNEDNENGEDGTESEDSYAIDDERPKRNKRQMFDQRGESRQHGGRLVDEDDTGDVPAQRGSVNRSTRGKYDRSIGRAKFEAVEVDLENNKAPIHREVILKDSDVPNFAKEDANYILHEDVDYPQFALGFTHWIHASKNKTEVFNTFTNKKRVYQVVNGYERYIDDHDVSIGSASKTYFEAGSRPGILSRAFYKLWEILYYFDLIDVGSKNFVSAHLAEGPGSFIQASMFFREMFAKDAKNDKYHAVTIHGEGEDTSLDLEKQFVEYYAKEKPQRFFMHMTVDSQTAGGSKTKDNGDLTKVKTIENFKKDVGGNKADLVTGDGGFEWNNENIQEQECASLIYAQILAAVNVQKKGGNFVLKLFETYTSVSMKFILLLKYFYEHVHIIKPLTSRDSNSEKYAVCIGFKFSENELSNILPGLMKVLDDMDQINSKRDKAMFMFDIFKNVKIPDDLRLNMLAINTEIANRQFKVINKMIEYLEGSNFHGELYMRYRTRQIELSKFWIETFLPSDKNLATGKEKTKKMVEASEKTQSLEYNRFRNHLIGYDVPKDKPKEKVEPPKKPATVARAKTASKAKANTKSKTKTKSKSKSKSNSSSKSKSKSKSKTKSKSKSKAKTTKKVTKPKADASDVKKVVKKTATKTVKTK
ncbi:FtsJ-like methyltransferase [Yasminevirus sp. GU-2018]|uniref:FtsJ-like methyltransferase n=1 Tax=Yasminevirus sp. GU-2018 TaxID=2420051 RepID=A0A5K0U7H4_9VIRU|nr:FtsJ-like methyltransferase [Yasminevirus sp. GU-2018]